MKVMVIIRPINAAIKVQSSQLSLSDKPVKKLVVAGTSFANSKSIVFKR